MIIPIFTPHGGCPERCHFCDQRVSGGQPVSVAKITATIEEFLDTGETAEEVAFYGGTFTAMPEARQLAYLEAVRPFLETARVGSIRIATRPDAIDKTWLRHLRDTYRLQTVELGVQSFMAPALSALGRTHSNSDVTDAMVVLKKLGLKTSLHLMIGVPHEGADSDRLMLDKVLTLRPDFVRIHPLLALKGTPLAEMARDGRFTPIALEEAVARAARLVEALEVAGIRVIRLGLQPNELLGQAVVAGPYHPAFGDLVRGRIYRDQAAAQISQLLDENRGVSPGIELLACDRIVGALKGPQKTNLDWLRERFNLSHLTVRVIMNRPYSYEQIEVRFHHTTGSAERG